MKLSFKLKSKKPDGGTLRLKNLMKRFNKNLTNSNKRSNENFPFFNFKLIN